jgi:hypothetical protein
MLQVRCGPFTAQIMFSLSIGSVASRNMIESGIHTPCTTVQNRSFHGTDASSRNAAGACLCSRELTRQDSKTFLVVQCCGDVSSSFPHKTSN